MRNEVCRSNTLRAHQFKCLPCLVRPGGVAGAQVDLLKKECIWCDGQHRLWWRWREQQYGTPWSDQFQPLLHCAGAGGRDEHDIRLVCIVDGIDLVDERAASLR